MCLLVYCVGVRVDIAPLYTVYLDLYICFCVNLVGFVDYMELCPHSFEVFHCASESAYICADVISGCPV